MPFIQTNNKYDFEKLCSERSIEALIGAYKQKNYPSRKELIPVLLQEIVTEPFYLIQKTMSQLANLCVLFYIKKSDKTKKFDLIGFLEIGTLQLLFPFFLVVIRISSIFFGLFKPVWALQGWVFAERGDVLSHFLWMNQAKMILPSPSEQEYYEEIDPTNALYFLGSEKTHSILKLKKIEKTKIKKEIKKSYIRIIHHLRDRNIECFRKFFYIEIATNYSNYISKGHRDFYISPNVKKLLSKFESKINDTNDTNPTKQEIKVNKINNKTDEETIKLILSINKIKKVEKIFNYIFFNLKAIFLTENLNLDPAFLNNEFVKLRDLFSLYYRFGRSHFPSHLNFQYSSNLN